MFGSRARATPTSGATFDFLVIEREVDDCFGEMARLGRMLGRLLIPADVVVVGEQDAQKWAAVKGTMIQEAMSDGWARFEPYLAEAGGDHERAIALYVWNARVSAAMFETLHHVEVALLPALAHNARSRDAAGGAPDRAPPRSPALTCVAIA